MKRVVIDTNVVASSALTPNGKPAEIMDLFFSGTVQVFYTEEMFAEYKRILTQKLKVAATTTNGILDAIEEIGTIATPTASTIPFVDESDRTFYDTAKECDAILITGNLKHYPNEPFIMNPASFLDGIAKR